MADLGTAAYKLVLDASQFANGAALTGRSMREVRKVMAETTTPAEKMASRLESVKEAFEKGAITQQAYNRWIEKFNRLAEEESAIIAELVVDTDKLEKEKRQLADAAQKQALAQQQAVQKQSAEQLRQMQHFASGTPVIGRYVGMLGHIHPAAIAATAGIAGIGAAMGAVAVAVKTYVGTMTAEFERLIQLGDEAAKLGLGPDALSALRMVGEDSSVSPETMGKGLQFMARGAAEAALGTGQARTALRQLGIDAKAFSQLSPEKQFMEIAEAMEGVDDGSQRIRLAYQIFGRSGVDILNTLAMGTEHLKETMGDVERFRLDASQQDIQAMREYEMAIGDVQDMWNGLWQQVAINVAPSMTAAVEQMNDALKDPEVQKAVERNITLLSMVGQSAPIIAADVAKIPAALERTFEILTPDWLQGILSLVPDGMLPSIMGTAEEIEQLKKFEEQMQGMFDPLRQANEARNQLSVLDAEEEVKKLEEIEKAEQQRTKSIEAAVAAYRDQIDTYGMAAREAELYRLAREAVTDEEREAVQVARELSAELDAMAASEQAMNDWLKGQEDTLTTAQREWDKFSQQVEKDRERTFSAAAKAVEQLRTPEEKYIDTVKELMDWLDLGALSITDFARLKANAAAELAKDMVVGKVVVDDVQAQAFGSAEMFRDIRRQQIQDAQAANVPAGPDTSALDNRITSDRYLARGAALPANLMQPEGRIDYVPQHVRQSDPLRTADDFTYAMDLTAEIFARIDSSMAEVAENTRAMSQENPIVRIAAEVP